MLRSKFAKFGIGVFIILALCVARTGVARAQNPGGPPDGWYPAYNWSPAGTGWGYSVPQNFRYPPVKDEGYDPSGNFEVLCNYSKKLLAPNMGAVFTPTIDGNAGPQTGPYSYTTYSSSLYVEYWASAYECWNSYDKGVDAGSSSLSGTGLQIDVNGSPAAIDFGSFDGATDPDRGGNGGDWKGYGRTVSLQPGYNTVCMKTWGTYNWRTGGVGKSEAYGPLGFGCIIVNYDRPPDGYLDVVDCNYAQGWARDPDDTNRTLWVRIYADNWPENGGRLISGGYANIYRSDVGSHGFKIPIDSAQDAYSNNFYAVAKTVDAFGNVTDKYFHLNNGGKSTAACKPPSCTVTANPATPQVGQDFDLILNYYYSPGSNGRPIDPNSNVRLDTGPNSSTYHFPSSTGGNNHAWGPYSRSTAGNFPVYGSITQPGKFTKNCDNNGDASQGVHVAVKPYLRVYGNDVQTGAKFGDANDSCTTSPLVNPKATALAFDDPIPTSNGSHSNDFVGAGTQFATFALGEISHFFSASQHTPRANTTGSVKTTPNNDLTFGNYNPSYSINLYGSFTGLDTTKVVNYGGVSGQIHCIPGFAYKKTAIPGPYTVNTTTATSVGAGQKIYTVVNGDIYINQNINFASNWSNNVDRIPSYYLVAKGGNIYISNAVTRLDGVFVAQPVSGTGGKIYTCYNTGPAGQAEIPAVNLYKTAANGGCRNKLTVNGALVADQVRFLRTQGTVNNAPRTTQLGLQWSFVGQIPNMDCTQIYEGAEPPSHTWTDNYLCVTPGKNLGLEWSQANPIPGKSCVRWNVPGEPAVYTWADNYLCWSAGKPLGLTFSATGPDASKFCTQIVENSDPQWGSNNYLCEPKASGPETSGSNNIAEVINFSPETYLANPDPVLQKGTVGSGYDYITSLSPIL